MTDAVEHVKSPCVRVCEIDKASGLCRGCLRTLDEIARWGGMPPEERRRVLADLPGRALPRRRFF